MVIMQQRHNKRSALLRAGPRSDGDTQKVAMQETPSSDFSLAFVMPPIRKEVKKHCRVLPSNQRKGIHMLQP